MILAQYECEHKHLIQAELRDPGKLPPKMPCEQCLLKKKKNFWAPLKNYGYVIKGAELINAEYEFYRPTNPEWFELGKVIPIPMLASWRLIVQQGGLLYRKKIKLEVTPDEGQQTTD